tara:strand:+ start:11483 stop:11716 length:234 start_codon:yes stop_codon:yes gene_type:complete
MTEPIKTDFLTCNQFNYNEGLNRYYEELESYVSYLKDNTNQRVIEELEDIVDDCIHIIREPMLQELLKRIKELKQER